MAHTLSLVALAIIFVAYALQRFAFFLFELLKPSPFPLINGKKRWELTNVRSKMDFKLGARDMIAERLGKVPEQPFRVIADVGEILILPPKYAHEIRNHGQLSFTQAAFKVG